MRARVAPNGSTGVSTWQRIRPQSATDDVLQATQGPDCCAEGGANGLAVAPPAGEASPGGPVGGRDGLGEFTLTVLPQEADDLRAVGPTKRARKSRPRTFRSTNPPVRMSATPRAASTSVRPSRMTATCSPISPSEPIRTSSNSSTVTARWSHSCRQPDGLQPADSLVIVRTSPRDRTSILFGRPIRNRRRTVAARAATIAVWRGNLDSPCGVRRRDSRRLRRPGRGACVRSCRS